VEKGEGHDFDLLVKLDAANTLRRHIETRIFKSLPPEVMDKVELILGDEAGPHDTFRPLFDLALVPSTNIGKVEMVKSDEIRSSEQLNEQSGITVKNVVDQKQSNEGNNLPEDKKPEDKVEDKTIKAIGAPGMVGTSTGPNDGGKTGTSVTGPRIASARQKVKDIEASLEEARKDADAAEKEPPKDEKKEVPAAVADKKPEDKYPVAEEKKKEVGEKKPYPAEDEDEKKLLELSDDLFAKGKLPEGLRSWREERKRKADPVELRLSNIEATMAQIAKSIETLTAINKAEPTTDDLVGKVAEETVKRLKEGSKIVNKSDKTQTVSPEGKVEATMPKSLAEMHDMPWDKVHGISDERARALGGQ
jgi:hypothetical protein